MSYSKSLLWMGDFRGSNDSAFDYGGCNSLTHTSSIWEVFVGDDQLASSNEDLFVTELLPEGIDISSSDEGDLNHLVLQDLQNLQVKESICSLLSNKDGNCNLLDMPSSATHATELCEMSKCATVLCSKVGESSPSTFDAKEHLSCIRLDNVFFDLDEALKITSLKPLPAAAKTLSALKGSRAQQGKPLDPKLHVTWATDVYDPAVTSSSHTVKGCRYRRPKVKERHKHKYIKGKPSKAHIGDKKHSTRSRSSVADPRLARLQALAGRSMQCGFEQSKAHAMHAAA